MKNIVYVIVDTDEEEIVRIGKPKKFPDPKNKDEDIKMCDDDIKTLAEGIIKLCGYMDIKDYRAIEDIMDEVHSQLAEGAEVYLKEKEADNNGD